MSIFIIVMPPPPDERPDDLVDAHYVAARFGCSASSVRHRLCGTGAIPRVLNNPLRFRRADVDTELLRLIEASRPQQRKAARLLTRRKFPKRS